MSRFASIALFCFFGIAANISAQQNENTASRSMSPSAIDATSPRPVSLKLFVPNILHDQKPIWTFPWKAVRGEHWKPVLGVSLITAGLVALDPQVEAPIRNHSQFDTYKTGPLRGRNSTLAITVTPAVFYLTGLVKHSRHAQSTGLLAAEGVVDTQILTFAMKHAFGRLEPSQIPPHGNFHDTWFKYKGNFTNGGSFPSGHAASAFAVATVLAHQYREHRWVPWLAYGTAGFLALTRLPDFAHFPSDIFLGSALGYTISRYVVMGR